MSPPLFALMVGSQSGLTRLLEKCGVEDAGREVQACAPVLRVHVPAGLVARLGQRVEAVRDMPICSAAYRRRYTTASAKRLLGCGAGRPEPFNRLFSTRPSNSSVESPARWSKSLIEGLGRESLRRPAMLLAWMFRIKPDIVVLLPDGRGRLVRGQTRLRRGRVPLGMSKEPLPFGRWTCRRACSGTFLRSRACIVSFSAGRRALPQIV